jgi:uncharacterized protein
VNRYVLDSWAFLAWLQDEPGAAAQVQDLIEAAEQNKCMLFASIINIGEVYYTLAKRVGPDRAMQFRNMIFRMPVKIISATDDVVWSAANFKSQYAISYTDAFAAAVALQEEAAIATGDEEVRQLTVPAFFWLRRG